MTPVAWAPAAAATHAGTGRLHAARKLAASPRLALTAAGAAALAAAAVYLVAARIPASEDSIVLAWVAIGAATVALGLFATLASRSLAPAQALLGTAVLFWVLWELLTPGHAISFAAGCLAAAMLVPLVAYQMLAPVYAHADRAGQAIVLLSAIVVAGCWIFLILTSRRPSLMSPLAECTRDCRPNEVFVGTAPNGLTSLARAGVQAGLLTAAIGVALYLAREFRATTSVARRGIGPVLALACAYALAVTVCVLTGLLARGSHPPLAWISLTAAVSLPLAMLAGVVSERLFMGEALEEFVNAVPNTDPRDLPGLMAQVLHEPGENGSDGFVPPPEWNGRAGPPGGPVTGQDVGPDQERFIRAAGAAARISQENHRLESDLSASALELAASRKRLVEAADAERRRIERDIHDGIQQRMVGARVKLELADDALESDPARGRQMLTEIGCDLDDALEEVRALAHGVYPALLETHGLVEALRSAARRAPGQVSVRGEIGRHPPDTEAAVYFCCLETLQNVAKHAGREATATVRLWEEDSSLRFQTRDSGVGFTIDGTPQGQGLVNMRDRLAAAGGELTLRSRPGFGTVVKGWVPID